MSERGNVHLIYFFFFFPVSFSAIRFWIKQFGRVCMSLFLFPCIAVCLKLNQLIDTIGCHVLCLVLSSFDKSTRPETPSTPQFFDKPTEIYNSPNERNGLRCGCCCAVSVVGEYVLRRWRCNCRIARTTRIKDKTRSNNKQQKLLYKKSLLIARSITWSSYCASRLLTIVRWPFSFIIAPNIWRCCRVWLLRRLNLARPNDYD